jgi:putative membrane protein
MRNLKTGVAAMAVLALLATPFVPAHANEEMMPANSTESARVEDFLTKAAIGDKFEVESSKIALARSKNAQVRAFAEQMIAEHSANGAKLKSAAASAGADHTLTNIALDQPHEDQIKLLNDIAAPDFDKTYAEAQFNAHKEAVALYDRYVAEGDNQHLKAFAVATLPTLKKHEDHVEALQEAVNPTVANHYDDDVRKLKGSAK